MKKTMHLFLAVLLLISICFANPIYAAHANVEQLEKTGDLAEYILQNLEAFSKEYNNMILDTASTYGISKNDLSLFQADFCENRFTIPCLYGEKSVECLDFDGANGYMIIDGQKVLKIVTQGNLDELYRYPGKVYFSELDNEFAYFDDENGYCTFGHRETEAIALETSYAGTDNGVIKNDLVYLNDKYPDFSEYEIYNSGYTNFNMDDEIYHNQNECSIYAREGTEGNCTLVAMHNALSFFTITNKYLGLPNPYATVIINPAEDYFYEDALMAGFSVYGAPSLPVLYKQIRQLAIDEYGYTTSNSTKYDGTINLRSITASDIPAFLSQIGDIYGIEINAQKRSANMNLFFQELWNNDVIIWSDNNDIYGSHTTVVTSACVYKKYSVILDVEVCTGTINMLSLWDGHNDQIVYYEFESSSGNGIIFNF